MLAKPQTVRLRGFFHAPKVVMRMPTIPPDLREALANCHRTITKSTGLKRRIALGYMNKLLDLAGIRSFTE